MKFNIPQEGDTRIVRRFALFPIIIYGDKTEVWLEFVKIVQRYDTWHQAWINWEIIE